MVKSEKDKGIEGYGEARGYIYENTYRKSIYVKGLLVFMLAPPVGYIPHHCRGTPLKGDADAVTLVWSIGTPTLTLLRLKPHLLPQRSRCDV
jgi:hypothetical protein